MSHTNGWNKTHTICQRSVKRSFRISFYFWRIISRKLVEIDWCNSYHLIRLLVPLLSLSGLNLLFQEQRDLSGLLDFSHIVTRRLQREVLSKLSSKILIFGYFIFILSMCWWRCCWGCCWSYRWRYIENELMRFVGSHLFFLNTPSHTKRKDQKIFAMRNWWYWCRCR